MPTLPLRIAILECDTPLGGKIAKYNRYGVVFSTLLGAAADALAQPGLSSTSGLALSFYDVVKRQEYPNLADIDAVLLSGSHHSAFADDEWIVRLVRFTHHVLYEQDRVRTIGVCFGHQIIGRAMGAPVGRSPGGWELSVTDVDLTERGQELFGRPALAIFQLHRDAVLACPEGVEPLAHTLACTVHGMYAPKRLITIQGHPEFNEEIMRELLTGRHAAGTFDDAMFEDAMGRVDKRHDGVVAAQAFLRVLLE